MITTTHKQTVARIINSSTNCQDAYDLWEEHCKAHGLRYSIEDWGLTKIGGHFFRLAEGD